MPKKSFVQPRDTATFSPLDDSGPKGGYSITLPKGSYELSKALKLCGFSNYRSRNVNINGKRTSMRFDTVLWNALRDIAAHENIPLNDLMDEIKLRAESSKQINLSATTRSFIVSYYKQKANL